MGIDAVFEDKVRVVRHETFSVERGRWEYVYSDGDVETVSLPRVRCDHSWVCADSAGRTWAEICEHCLLLRTE